MYKSRLDFDKCVGFGCYDASPMIGKKNGVTARLKKKINSFLTFVHCVINRMNVTAIDATKVLPCKELSREIDSLLNSIAAMHFKKLCKKKNALL